MEAHSWQTFLLVEDNPLTRKVVRAAVANDDYEMLEAHTGAQALAILDKHTPRVILQDLLLPDQSGFELVRKLRAHPSAAGVPILAFTGLVSQDEEARISNAGFDGLITKPVEPSHLRYLLRGHFATPDRDRPFGSGKRLLIVDDNPVQLKLARFRLSRLGFLIDVAGDGVQALEVARRTKPHAIVTDVLMPRLDGFGLCLELRKDPELANTTVVMATSSYVENADHQLALQVGANAIVIRSADLSEVIRALEQAMKTPFVPPLQAHDQTLQATRAERTMRQLERQVGLNSGLLQRCAMLSAEVSVLSTVAEALVSARDIDEALSDILANCLDVVGASRGAIFSMPPDGTLKVAALHGLVDADRLAKLFAKDSVQRAILQAEEPLRAGELLGAALTSEPAIRETAIVVSLRAHGQRFGALLIDTPASLNVEEQDWHAFANAISNQVSLALALTTAFARVEASEHRVRSLMDSAGDGIFVSREDGRILEVNPAGERLVGRTVDGILGTHIDSLIVDDHAVTPAGRRIPVEVSASFVFVGGERVRLHIVRDVSERNAMAAQLRQSQKLEAIGRLAGGVAHDFNNLLSVVLSYSYVLLAGRDPSDPIVEDITEIKHAGERASELTSQLLAFSRNQVVQPRVVALNEIVESSERMLRRLLGQEVALVFSLGADVGKMYADASQVHQVLLNLVVNARDAIPQGRSGRIVVETANATVEPNESLARDGLAPGRYVVLSVMDDGVGMDREVRNRIFEPFFTTKGPSKGTGLGLATVFGIVDQAHGRIVVDSEPGHGTTFRVYLPRTDRIAATVPSPEQESSRDLAGDETILVVEDEPQVRTIVCAILRRAGYHVYDVASPGDALLVAEQIATPIHLLLTDVVMPRMNGVELAARLGKTRNAMKVLLMSGHTGEAINPNEAAMPFLQKPIRPTPLLRSVRDTLDGHAAHK